MRPIPKKLQEIDRILVCEYDRQSHNLRNLARDQRALRREIIRDCLRWEEEDQFARQQQQTLQKYL
jgi:hypothetical protein